MRSEGVARRALMGLCAVAVLSVLAVALWPERHEPPGPTVSESSVASPLPSSSRPLAAVARPVPAAKVTVDDALARALHEEQVPVASGVRIESIESDRPWVCAGESMGLSARV